MRNQSFLRSREIVWLMISEVEMRASQVLFHLSYLVNSGFPGGVIIGIRIYSSHLRTRNCLILEEVS